MINWRTKIERFTENGRVGKDLTFPVRFYVAVIGGYVIFNEWNLMGYVLWNMEVHEARIKYYRSYPIRVSKSNMQSIPSCAPRFHQSLNPEHKLSIF